MAYLGIDVDGARELSEQLRIRASVVDDALHELVLAEALADLPTGCSTVLDEIADTFTRIAGQIDWAVETLLSLRIRIAAIVSLGSVPGPVRTPEPVVTWLERGGPGPAATHPTQWDAAPARQWQHVHQLSSHNSYEVSGGVELLFDAGVRSFELDIHHSAPGAWLEPLLPAFTGSWSPALAAAPAGEPPQWHVYHVTGASFREYDTIRQGLTAIASLKTSDPITIFIDNKDGFGGQHTVDAFDHVLAEVLGSRLYTPAMLHRHAPDAVTLVDAAQTAGWPKVDELQGRIIVVLTDELEGYARPGALAFIAPPPQFVETAPGSAVHLPQYDAVFYNANAREISPQRIEAVHATNTMLRTYFNPRCASNVVGEVPVVPHYRAVDVVAVESVCQESAQVPPAELPVALVPAE